MKLPNFVDLVEVWRGDFLECVHQGHAVVCDNEGKVIAQWGDTSNIILPRSSCKMLQALPLIESGAAARFNLTPRQLALSCASHQGAHIHTSAVTQWLTTLDLGEQDLRCGAQPCADTGERAEMIRTGLEPDQRHNNCSGKHSGFLTLNKHLGGHGDYVEVDHPVQLAVRAATEDMCGQEIAGHAIDGCSAPNFGVTLHGLALGMARMAAPISEMGKVRGSAARELVQAMHTYPDMVAGKGRACTEMMQGMPDGTVVKTGAEGVFVAIIPSLGFGVALKIRDGATRASEAAMAAILVRLGVADATHPMIAKRMLAQLINRRDVVTGGLRPVEAFYQDGALL